MKYIKTIFFSLAAALTLSGCAKSDPFKGEVDPLYPPELSDDTPLNARIKKAYEEYQVHYKPDFEVKEFQWNWVNNVDMNLDSDAGWRYTHADKTVAIEVIDFVEKTVFDVFPLDFAKRYMARSILMVDTMERWFKNPDDSFYHVPLEGYLNTNALVLPYVSTRFHDVKTKRLLPESWLSLFVEKALSSLPVIPKEFATISDVGYRQIEIYEHQDVTDQYAILKRSRTKQRTAEEPSTWDVTKLEQDFADYVAFAVYTPKEEKELIYAKNANVKVKETLVRNYFLINFDIELPYLPIQN